MKLAKNFELEKQVLKDLLYASIRELGENPKVYSNSAFGPKYSKYHEESKDICLAVLEDYIQKIITLEQKLQDERFAKKNWEALKQHES